MNEFFQKLFYSDFMSHGHCYFWKPEIVWLHAISDGLIALSYYFIPVMLVYLVRKRRDLPFHWMFIGFGIFILSCGTTHAMEIWTLWHGTYRLAGVIKAITAVASITTAVALVPMVPKALQLSSPEQLQQANLKLEKEIAERLRVEETLQVERDFVSAVLDTIDTLILVLDGDDKVVKCNQACEQVSGWRMNELNGRQACHLFRVVEEAEHFRRMIERVRNSSRPATFESHWTDANGNLHIISWATTILAAENNRKGPLLIFAGADITESKALEKAVLDISSREQRRIAQDLHDGLGQHLTGIAFLSKVVERNLVESSEPNAPGMTTIVKLVNEAIDKTRELARGLLPVSSESGGLMAALKQWAVEVQNRYGIFCRFTCPKPVLIYDDDEATHLYRIAQEAVSNSIRHGHPTQIEISLTQMLEGAEMSIRDDGIGMGKDVGENTGKPGLGLRIMNYRAKMIEGTLQVQPDRDGGTVVTCRWQPAGRSEEPSVTW